MSDTVTPICDCGVPVKDGYACHECIAQLGRNLLHLAKVIKVLEQVAGVGRGGGIPTFTVGRKWVAENKPLPLNEAAWTAIGHCWDEGVVLCGALVAGFIEPAKTPWKAVGMLTYASEHVDLLRREVDAPALIDNARDLMKEISKILDRAPEKRPTGWPSYVDQKVAAAGDELMLLDAALDWLRIYKGRRISKRTAMSWIADPEIMIPERKDEKGRHRAVPTTLLEEADQPKKGRRTTAA